MNEGGLLNELSKIEKVSGVEDVLKWLSEGLEWREILHRLHEIYPGEKFTKKDLDLFMIRNKEIAERAIKENKNLLNKHVSSNLEFRDKLLAMQTMIYESMHDASQEKNYSGLASLHNSILSSLKLYAQMTGQLDNSNEESNVNVNISRVIDGVEDKKKDSRVELLEKVATIRVNKKDE